MFGLGIWELVLILLIICEITAINFATTNCAEARCSSSFNGCLREVL